MRCHKNAPRGQRADVMFFLIRVAFWLSIVVLLLPTGSTKETGKQPQIGAVDALAAAGAAVSDMRQFCTRQPEACDVGSQAAVAFGQKAQASAKMLYEFLTERLPADQPGEGIAKPAATVPAGEGSRVRPVDTTGAISGVSSQDTLTPADRAPAWRGPVPRPQPAPRSS